MLLPQSFDPKRRSMKMKMRDTPLWKDPWIAVAATEGTRLPPRMPVLGPHLSFTCTPWQSLSSKTQTEWIALVGTHWSASTVEIRLAGALIPCLFVASPSTPTLDGTLVGTLVATCVIRTRLDVNIPIHILETLTAQHGYATTLLRSVARRLYDTTGPFALTYTWELTTLQLVMAWARGWMVSAVEIQRGWVWKWKRRGGCRGQGPGPLPLHNAFDNHPQLLHHPNAWCKVTNSGLNDRVGYVTELSVASSTSVWDWDGICAAGQWTHLWFRSSCPPPSSKQKGGYWTWTGEWVVVGCLNHRLLEPHISIHSSTSELSHGPSSPQSFFSSSSSSRSRKTNGDA